MNTEFVLAPTVQGGYYATFQQSNWLWGIKLGYTHLDATSTAHPVLIPQEGSFTAQATNATTPFTGNAIARSSATTIVQQVSLIPIIGQSFGNGFVYAGAGLTYSELRADQYQLVGFADINGNRQDVSGAPQDFKGSGWTPGGAATVGATYFFDRSWFVDLNYRYGINATRKFDYASSYTNSKTSNGTTNVGTLVGYSSFQLMTHAVTLTINRAF
jgi:opacity protein-like surface antigen